VLGDPLLSGEYLLEGVADYELRNKTSSFGVKKLTVQQDVQKAVASAEAAQGSYLMFASSTQDQSAKQMFQSMASDMQRHIDQLKGRGEYLAQSNPLNQQQQQQQQ